MNCELRGTPKFARGTGSLVRIAYADEESQGRGSSGRIGRGAIAFTEQDFFSFPFPFVTPYRLDGPARSVSHLRSRGDTRTHT